MSFLATTRHSHFSNPTPRKKPGGRSWEQGRATESCAMLLPRARVADAASQTMTVGGLLCAIPSSFLNPG